uniref:Glutathione peroxidase 4 n=1 Tax=Sphenodon punctatus TaxID=8508 RepID=A0A8D0L4Y4_SPHPU
MESLQRGWETSDPGAKCGASTAQTDLWVALQCAQGDDDWKSAKSIFGFHAKDIDGNDISLEKYKGHVCIITNVASK